VVELFPRRFQLALLAGALVGVAGQAAVVVVAFPFPGGAGGLHVLGDVQELLAFFFEMGGELILLLVERGLLLLEARFLIEEGGLLGGDDGHLDA